MHKAREGNACWPESSSASPRGGPSALESKTAARLTPVAQRSQEPDNRHACRIPGKERLAGKSYFGKTGQKRVCIVASAPSAPAAPPQCAELVVPTKVLT